MDFAEILIVDDEIDICNALRRELRSKVATVYTATKVEQGLEILASQHIDLIVTDYRMPMMTGTEFLLEVKKRFPEVPAVMLSGQADFSGVTAALNAGVISRYIDKPWDAKNLADAIKETLSEQEPSIDRRTQMATESALNRSLSALPECSESGFPWLLLVVDIANLTEYNSVNGKVSGNAMIQKMADIIIRSTENVWYRVGDKFISLIECSVRGYQALNNLMACIHQECHITQNQVAINCYLAEAKCWKSWNNQNFLGSKSAALFIGKNLHWLIQENNSSVGEEFQELGLLIDDFSNGNLKAFFQPQMTLGTQSIECCEALVRRQLPDNSYQSPVDFLYLIEKYGLDDMLTTLMMKDAIKLLDCVGKSGQLTVSVNVTAKQLITGFARELLCNSVENSSVAISDIELEVVEGEQVFDYQRALEEFRMLQKMGVTIAMDDFGTGYSGFESLCELPFDVVKIDGRFIRALGNGLADEVILSSIINSAKSLKMEVVAEWVERSDQAEYLKKIGGTRIQGYLVSPPLPMDKFLSLLKESK
ncbi:EAL domain-containing protein [Marinomonas sp. C2222]|uniref:EAL domain-containing protein n=1 Tax=Marinomonas sargassi TaxID=2984494 RepID=A0ABT2YUA3_9GAMM|nr:EAL domain-containing protein [Marinomonas sargassi]MCV2403474.1 EAL domain-containing protein [Marinomonas sargassi]